MKESRTKLVTLRGEIDETGLAVAYVTFSNNERVEQILSDSTLVAMQDVFNLIPKTDYQNLVVHSVVVRMNNSWRATGKQLRASIEKVKHERATRRDSAADTTSSRGSLRRSTY